MQKDLLVEETLQVLARLHSHALQLLAFMTDDDTFLAVACNVDRRRDAVDLRLLTVLLDRDLDAVRHLFVVVEEDLLADNLRGEETQRLVGQRIFRIVGLTLGQHRENQVEQPTHIEILLSRNGNNARCGHTLVPLLDQRFECLGRGEVDLVDHNDCRDIALCHLVEDLGRAIGVLDRVGNVEQHVGVLQRTAHETHHRLLELVVGFENTRRIRVNYLKIIAIDNTHNAVARSLRL